MAMALMLQELNAANFSSSDADSGDVLTANGSGGASWEAPTGGNAGLVLQTTGAWTNQSTVFTDISASLPVLIPELGYIIEFVATCLDTFWVGKFILDNGSANSVSLAGNEPPALARMLLSVINIYEQ